MSKRKNKSQKFRLNHNLERDKTGRKWSRLAQADWQTVTSGEAMRLIKAEGKKKSLYLEVKGSNHVIIKESGRVTVASVADAFGKERSVPSIIGNYEYGWEEDEIIYRMASLDKPAYPASSEISMEGVHFEDPVAIHVDRESVATMLIQVDKDGAPLVELEGTSLPTNLEQKKPGDYTPILDTLFGPEVGDDPLTVPRPVADTIILDIDRYEGSDFVTRNPVATQFDAARKAKGSKGK